jgi:deazaflavin-dependent oxidoreductase (nitroreductase family)
MTEPRARTAALLGEEERAAISNRVHIPLYVRIISPILLPLLRLGLRIPPMALLTVRGRRSGQPRSTPVGLLEIDGHRYLFSAFGEVNWVRNLRAAGVATIGAGRRRETLPAAELRAEDAGGVVRSILKTPRYAAVVRPYFPVSTDAPLTEFVREARRHPVFELGVVPVRSAADKAPLQS